MENTKVNGVVWDSGTHHLYVDNKPASMYVLPESIIDTYNQMKMEIKQNESISIGIDHLNKATFKDNDILKKLESTLLPDYPYTLTDLFLHQTQYFQLLSYIQNKPYVPWTQSPFKDGVEVPTINGVRIHNIGQLILNDGDYIGIDSRYPGITVFQYIDPDISSKGSININQVTELNYPFNIVTEFFSESGYAPKLPNALYYAEKAL